MSLSPTGIERPPATTTSPPVDTPPQWRHNRPRQGPPPSPDGRGAEPSKRAPSVGDERYRRTPRIPTPPCPPAANGPPQIKCNGEKPTCANCKIYGKECTFEPLGDSRASPASARRSYHSRAKAAGSLRASQSHPAQGRTNEQCNRNGGGGEDGESGDRTRRCGSEARDAGPEPDRDSEPRRSRTGISRIVVSPNGVSSYHGQTSSLFEENQPERAPAGDARPRMPDDWVEKGLVAEAAKQRASIPPPSLSPVASQDEPG